MRSLVSPACLCFPWRACLLPLASVKCKPGPAFCQNVRPTHRAPRVIFHKHRAIFIHIPKTGGGSIENWLWPDKKSRTEADLWMGFVDRYGNRYQTGGLQHLPAIHVRQAVGCAIFASYFKFAMIRNPWDKVISQYVFMSRREDLREFIGMREGDGLMRYLELISGKPHVQWDPQVRFLFDENGDHLVDYIGRFETFNESVGEIEQRLGLALGVPAHTKKGLRGPYADYYDAESEQMVGAMYADDIKAFGYRFR